MWNIFTSFKTCPEFFRIVVLADYNACCYHNYPNDQTHCKSYLFLPSPRSGTQWESYTQVALDTDGCCCEDAGIHVDIMYIHEKGTKVSYRQAGEGIVNPEAQEKDEGKIWNVQVHHIDVRVCPRAPYGNEGIQSSSIYQETQKKQSCITQTLKIIHCAIRGTVGGNVANGLICRHIVQYLRPCVRIKQSNTLITCLDKRANQS